MIPFLTLLGHPLFLSPFFLGTLILCISLVCLHLLWKRHHLQRTLHQTWEDLITLEKETRRLRGMIDGVTYPIWHRDAQLRINDCNLAYAAVLEQNREAILGTDQELTSSKSRQQKLARTAYEEKRMVQDFFHAVMGQKRSLIYVHEVCYEEHQVGFALDYTPLEKSEQLLKEHLSSQQSLLENLSTGIGVFGADTRLQFFNRAYVQLSGCEESWLSTHPPLGDILEEMRARRRLPEYTNFPAYKKSLLAQFTNLTVPEEEMTYRPDGHAIRRVTAPYPKGGLVYMFEDVTDRLTLEQQYQTLMAVQRETLNGLYEGIVVFGSDHRIKLLNPAFHRIWHLPSSVVGTGDHLTDFLERIGPQFQKKEDWDLYKKSLTSLLSTRLSLKGKILCQENRSLAFNYSPLPDGAHLLTYLDTTDQDHIEKALREKNQALEEASHLKSQFIRHISYELRTPLNTIIGFSEILENHYFGTLNPQQHDYTKGILQASHQLLSLIDDLLDLAAIESGEIELDREPIALEDLLILVKNSLQERVQESHLSLDLSFESSLPILKIDSRRIKHALCHLIHNSIKFTEPGGRITLGARREEAWILLWVEDTGIGISESDQQRIFGPFEKGQNQPIRHHGAGIGLSLVKSLIELHGGYLRIQSTYNKGTTIYCYLPYPSKEYSEECKGS